jgi:hypothetical protein
VILDLDGRHPPYGDWLCAAAPRYRPAAVEEFFTARGFDCARVDTVWRFECRTDLEAALRIEFPAEVAASAIAATPGLTVPVRYRVHVWRKPAGLLSPTSASRRSAPTSSPGTTSSGSAPSPRR